MIHHGDCLEVMAGLPAESVDAIVTDPPYGLGFMGKEWDALPPGKEWADECLRVLKPGGHLVAFGGSRTYHRLAVAIEDAGFEIRDQLMWLYGSGFPKSLDVSKAIDRAAGAEREVIGPGQYAGRGRRTDNAVYSQATTSDGETLTAPATPEAQKWNGWGTALKPSHEPVVLARKPLTGTVAANVQEYGTGALNVDGCRVESDAPIAAHHGTGGGAGRTTQKWLDNYRPGDAGKILQTAGRWPANLILDPEAGAMLDEQSGESTTKRNENPSEAPGGNTWGGTFQTNRGARGHSDTGGASRFFYTAKASSAERNAGLDGFEARESQSGMAGAMPIDDRGAERDRFKAVQQNVHPTVKPIDLMRWLVRLVTPPGGTVLDPFTGSGTTGIAAALEGFDFIGIEREDEYLKIAEARIEWWSRHEGDTAEILVRAGLAEKAQKAHAEAGQLGLLGDTA